MRGFYEQSLWILQHFLLMHPDLHHRLLGVVHKWQISSLLPIDYDYPTFLADLLRPPLGLPVLRLVPFACMPSPIPGRDRWNLFARAYPVGFGLPTSVGGSAPALYVFEACSAFTHVTAYLPAKSPLRPSTPEAPAASLPPPPLRLLLGGANSSRAGLPPAVDPRLFSAHDTVVLGCPVSNASLQCLTLRAIERAEAVQANGLGWWLRRRM